MVPLSNLLEFSTPNRDQYLPLDPKTMKNEGFMGYNP